jgi:hypothetical protein
VLDALKREVGLLRDGGVVPSFEVRLPRASIAALASLSARCVTGLARLAWLVLRGGRGFPSLADLGFSRPAIALLQHRVPASPEEMLVIGRLDVTTDGTRHFSYELNGSQPGGIDYAEIFSAPRLWARREATGSIYEAFVGDALYRYRREAAPREPLGILVLGHGYHQLNAMHASLERAFGRPVLVAEDARQCSFDGEHFYGPEENGRAAIVDLVLRSPRASFEQLLAPENRALRRAWRRGKVLLVNPPHAKVVGWKPLFALASRDTLCQRAGVTEAEWQALKTLASGVLPVNAHHASRFQEERELWVLKHPSRGRGALVWIGAETPPREWRARIAHAARGRGWICQRFHAPYVLEITIHDREATRLRAPVSVDPYVTLGAEVTVPGFLCRAVIPTRGDPAELERVKLNLMGENRYVGSDGAVHQRTVGFGQLFEIPA